jgi:hypothetical protein
MSRLDHILGQGFAMPSPDHHPSQEFESKLERKLALLSRELEKAKVKLGGADGGVLDGVGTAFEELKDGFASVQQKAPSFAPQSDRHSSNSEDGPWDRASAEALTRVWEMAETELQADPRPRAEHARPAPAPAARSLEERLTDIADSLQRALADAKPDQWLAALAPRFDQLQQQFEGTLADAVQRLDVGGLTLLEAHMRELTGQFDHVRGELTRLDAIENHLRDLGQRLEQRQAGAEVGRPAEGGPDFEAMIEAAVERLANRLTESMPRAKPVDDAQQPDRVAFLEGVLQDYIAERRRGDEVTGTVLHTIEDALHRILDRIDAMEVERVAAAEASSDPNKAERELLSKAYADGAHALGHDRGSAQLHAADYATSPRGIDPPTFSHDRPEGSAPARPDAGIQRREELRLSALRGKLKAHTPGELAAAPDKGQAADQPRPPRRKRTGIALASRGVLLLTLTGGLLLAAGYIVTDYLLPDVPAHDQDIATGFRSDDIDRGSSGEKPAPDSAGASRLGGLPQAVPTLASRQLAASAEAPSDMELPEAIGTASLRHAAIHGDALAAFEVASRFADGKGLPSDPVQAFAWYRRSAMRGYAPAQHELAMRYEKGLGVSVDRSRAKLWYRRAAEQGHAPALHNLAVLLSLEDNGRGAAAAARLFQEAAERGAAETARPAQPL